jgi:hypothetical protein
MKTKVAAFAAGLVLGGTGTAFAVTPLWRHSGYGITCAQWKPAGGSPSGAGDVVCNRQDGRGFVGLYSHDFVSVVNADTGAKVFVKRQPGPMWRKP